MLDWRSSETVIFSVSLKNKLKIGNNHTYFRSNLYFSVTGNLVSVAEEQRAEWWRLGNKL